MKLVRGTLYALRIPFVEAFRHSARERESSDSVVLRVESDGGAEGFGEGAPRPYVTGETVESMLRHIETALWPPVAGRDVPAVENEAGLAHVDRFIPERPVPGLIADHAARAAMELAILDCALRAAGRPLGEVLRPRRRTVRYSGVITAGSAESARKIARQMKTIGFDAVKVKVGVADDAARLAAVRDVLGPGVSLRVDANGAWSPERALTAIEALRPFGLACVEQPIPRGAAGELRRLRDAGRIPVMADESLVTAADARGLIEARAVDFFNVRVSKCGGLARSLDLVRIASRAGIRVQIGSQVGETAILAAAGRHLAAAVDDLAFAEGSFGTLLLAEDVSADPVRFGHRGDARLLTGPGLGVRVLEPVLRKYAVRTVELACS